MRIAVVETAAHGGLLHYAFQLGQGLAGRGHTVDLVVPRDNELVGQHGPARMRAVLTPPVRAAAPAPTGIARLALRRAGVAVRLARAWWEVIRASRRGGYDVVLINASLHLSIAAIGALALALLPHSFRITHVAHNADVLDRRTVGEHWSRATLVRALLRPALARFDLIFVHGDRSREEFERRWPTTAIALIPHGDERIFGEPPSPSEEERVLFFGDWNRAKGLPILMAAFDRLAERRPDARLTIAGTPFPREVDVDAIKAWAAAHDRRVELIDHYVPLADVAGLFARARVVVAPYVVGYQSGVVHLAMTMGRAVVACDVGDLSSVVRDGETGIVVAPESPELLREALERVVSDPELAERFGRAGRHRVIADSGWEQVAARSESALAALLAQRRHGRR